MTMILNNDSDIDEEISEPMDEQKDVPFSLPTDIDDPEEATMNDTHQVTDTEVDAQEIYDEGLSGAAEAKEPNLGSAVVGYDPSKDQRRQNK